MTKRQDPKKLAEELKRVRLENASYRMELNRLRYEEGRARAEIELYTRTIATLSGAVNALKSALESLKLERRRK